MRVKFKLIRKPNFHHYEAVMRYSKVEHYIKAKYNAKSFLCLASTMSAIIHLVGEARILDF